MNIIRQILGSIVIAAVLTQLAVYLTPDMNYIRFVVPAMQIGTMTIIGLSAIAVQKEGKLQDNQKKVLMTGFLVAIMSPSLLTAGAFMHETQTTWTNGEIHWHADFEVLIENDTGEIYEAELASPQKFCQITRHESTYMCSINDRTGSTEYHEHNDDRIHLEGSFKTREDASLASFFDAFYGELTNTRLEMPTDEGNLSVVEDGERSLKILVIKGVGGERGWCAIGEEVPRNEMCRSNGKFADSPRDYVVSSHTQNPANSVILDNIYFVYDSRNITEALADVREDGEYRGMGITKEGEGVSG